MEREFLVQRTLRRGFHFDSDFVFVISVFTFAVFHICGRLRSVISPALDAHQLEKRKGAGFPQDPSRYLLSNLPHPLPRRDRLPHTPSHATIANRPTSHLLCQFIGAVFFWGNPSLVAFDVFVDGCQPVQPLLALAVFFRSPHGYHAATSFARSHWVSLCQFIGAVFFWGSPPLVAFDVFVDSRQLDQSLLALAVFSVLQLLIMQPQVLL